MYIFFTYTIWENIGVELLQPNRHFPVLLVVFFFFFLRPRTYKLDKFLVSSLVDIPNSINVRYGPELCFSSVSIRSRHSNHHYIRNPHKWRLHRIGAKNDSGLEAKQKQSQVKYRFFFGPRKLICELNSRALVHWFNQIYCIAHWKPPLTCVNRKNQWYRPCIIKYWKWWIGKIFVRFSTKNIDTKILLIKIPQKVVLKVDRNVLVFFFFFLTSMEGRTR